MLAVSFAIAFALTWVFWKEDEEESGKKEKNTADVSPKEAAGIAAEEHETESSADGMEGNDNVLYAPVKGNVIPRDAIPDATFAAGILGDGVGIEPEEGLVVSPVDGEISTVVDSRHAVGISGPKGMEILIHVGVDTVNMKGDGFTCFVKEGDKVKAGQKLIAFDIDKIQKAGYSSTTAVLLTNSDDYSNFMVKKTGRTERMEELFSV